MPTPENASKIYEIRQQIIMRSNQRIGLWEDE
jgi:hypothetical protein